MNAQTQLEGPTATKLAQWIEGLTIDAVPTSAREHAKDCVIDSVACAIGSLELEPMRVLMKALSEIMPGTVPVPGTGQRLGIAAAAHFGAQAANALDFDDSFRSGAPSHPGATVVPPALAVAMARGSSGAQLLTAIIAGFEVSLRIGRAVQPSPERKSQVMGFAAWQSFGAASAAAKLLALDRPRILDALGLTGAQAPVPAGRKFLNGQRPYSWIKNAYGISGEVGVRSALLAEAGYHGDQEIFDGPYGFWIMCGSDRFQREKATEALGARWLLQDIGFKPYACCRWTHTMIDAIRQMLPTIGQSTVRRVTVSGYRELVDLAGPVPESIIDAQFHARYIAALELAGHSPELGLQERHLADPAVLELASSIDLVHEPAFDEAFNEKGELPVRVEIALADGRLLAATATHPAGSPAAGGFDKDAMDRKFKQLCSPLLGRERAADALAMLRELESASAAEIADALTPIPSRG